MGVVRTYKYNLTVIVLVRIIEALGQLAELRSMPSWVSTVAARTCLVPLRALLLQ